MDAVGGWVLPGSDDPGCGPDTPRDVARAERRRPVDPRGSPERRLDTHPRSLHTSTHRGRRGAPPNAASYPWPLGVWSAGGTGSSAPRVAIRVDSGEAWARSPRRHSMVGGAHQREPDCGSRVSDPRALVTARPAG